MLTHPKNALKFFFWNIRRFIHSLSGSWKMNILFGITNVCHISYDISKFLIELSSSTYNNLARMKRKCTGQLSLCWEPIPKVVEHPLSGARFRSTSATASLSSSTTVQYWIQLKRLFSWQDIYILYALQWSCIACAGAVYRKVIRGNILNDDTTQIIEKKEIVTGRAEHIFLLSWF